MTWAADIPEEMLYRSNGFRVSLKYVFVITPLCHWLFGSESDDGEEDNFSNAVLDFTQQGWGLVL